MDKSRKIDNILGDKIIQISNIVYTTDTGEATEGMSEGIANLFRLLKASECHEAHDSLMQDYQSGALKYVDLKEAVANGLVTLNEQFRSARAELNANKKEVKNQVKASSAEIRKRAQETIKQVKDLAGLLNVKF